MPYGEGHRNVVCWKPHERFDEGWLAKEHGEAIEALPDESGRNRYILMKMGIVQPKLYIASSLNAPLIWGNAMYPSPLPQG